jgi:hypothetical protein
VGSSLDAIYQISSTTLTSVTAFLNSFNVGGGSVAPWVLAIGF